MDKSNGRWIKPPCGNKESRQEREIRTAAHGPRQPRPDSLVQLRQVIGRYLRKEVMLKMKVLVEEAKRHGPRHEHAAAGQQRIMSIGDAMLRKAADVRHVGHDYDRQSPAPNQEFTRQQKRGRDIDGPKQGIFLGDVATLLG